MKMSSENPGAASPDTDQALQQALTCRRAGQLREAEGIYRTILQAQPNQAEANHNLGLIALHLKKPTGALPYLKIALEVNPRQEQYWLSYIEALILTDQVDAARKILADGQQRGLRGAGVDILLEQLQEGESGTERPRVTYQGALKKLPPALRAATRVNHKKRSKSSLSNPTKALKRTNLRAEEGSQPSSQETKTLGMLFNQGRYAELETLAQMMTVRFPQYGIGWKAVGTALQKQGRSEEALAFLQKAVLLLPRDADAWNNLGNALLAQSRLLEAEAGYRQALKLTSGYAEVHNNLGVTLQGQGRLAEAEASLRRALDLKPDFANAHYNLGNTLLEEGRLAEAEASFHRVLQLNPAYAEAYNNLGNTNRAQGRLAVAESCYRQAMKCKPQLVEALNNLAGLLIAQGEPDKALSIIKRSLQTKETWEAKTLFVSCVKRLRFAHVSNDVRGAFVRALSEPWSWPGELAQAGAALVKHEKAIEECVARATTAWPQRLPALDLFGSSGLAAVTVDPLLGALLESGPICDMDLERFLTMARRTMLEPPFLEGIPSGKEKNIIDFYSALARQCFINEYVFAQTDEEFSQARNLLDSLVVALEAGIQPSVLLLVVVAAYFPLHSIPHAGRLLDWSWPEAVSAVLVQQVCEPEEERQHRATIPCLTTIKNEVSLLVQHQYEVNPYPRWVKAAIIDKPLTIAGFLRQYFPLVALRSFETKSDLDILIAGSGTGYHPIETGQRFCGARVLAIDLSLSSLCYAKRKTQELGLTMIDYAQADILRMGEINRSFDIIETSGVLHHLADPLAGWRVLLSMLRPGGFMRLGLYSEVARRDVVRVRSFIAEQGYGSTADDIRRCRQDLMDLDKSIGLGSILESGDFFSVSACRDLFFHVQEHHLTLTDIGSFLAEHDLQFLGFEINSQILQAYRMRFPEDITMTNLDCWQTFENENPGIFLRMYQFWVQKAVH